MNKLIDSVFNPVLDFLNNAQSKLENIGTISAKGLDLDNYLGFINVLGNSWSGVVSSLLTSLMFLGVLYAVKTNSSIYLWFKSMVKWW